jgi:DNA-binding MarR family transcriptional regulator
MAKLTNEQRRALRLLSRRLDGCAEAVLLAEGFSIGQLAELALEGLVETKRAPVGGGRHSVWIKITEAGRKAITE